MNEYILISLNDMIEQLGEDETNIILSDFSCPQNKDIEAFLRKNAIPLSAQGVAKTHLIFLNCNNKKRLIAYYTLSNKCFTIPSTTKLSSNLRHRIKKFAIHDKNTDTYMIIAPLIAQIGKNFNDGLNNLITGDELLKLACDKVKSVQSEIGGKIVYLECEDKPQLLDFYASNGFVIFGKRLLDKDEKDSLSGKYLIQMLKYL